MIPSNLKQNSNLTKAPLKVSQDRLVKKHLKILTLKHAPLPLVFEEQLLQVSFPLKVHPIS
jgi:hypothetical protein